MALRFRKTFKIAPGLKVNIGKKSASVRAGGKNLGFTAGTAGQRISGSAPGTGLGITHKLGTKQRPGTRQQPKKTPAYWAVAILAAVLVVTIIWVMR